MEAVAGAGGVGHWLVAVDQAKQHRARRGRAILAGSIGSIALVLGAIWLERRDLAGNLIDRRLSAAAVPAQYRIATLGPAVQVIEDVRLGDPTQPDFTARRIVLRWRYRLGLPTLAAITIEGGRLRARWRDGALSFGAIDRLLPRSRDGGPALPEFDVQIHDTQVALATPAGTASLGIEGAGNAARSFRGTLHLDAPALARSGCGVRRVAAVLRVSTTARKPSLRGPVSIGGAACRSPALAIGEGTAAIDLVLAPTLDRAAGKILLTGFAGRAGGVGFGPIRGAVSLDDSATIAGTAALDVRDIVAPDVTARSGALNGRYRYVARNARFEGVIAVGGLATPRAIPEAIRTSAAALHATPLGPIATALGRPAARFASGSTVLAPISVTAGERTAVWIDRATVRAIKGSVATISASVIRDGGAWQGNGTLDGTNLPRFTIEATSSAARSIDAVLRVAPYRAGTATLALNPVRLIADNGVIRFATVAMLDGPLGAGSIEGLTVPLVGRADRDGLRVGSGCQPISFRHLRLAGTTLDPARIEVCGTPIVSKSATGPLRVAANIRDLALTGRSGTAPLTMRAAMLRIDERHLAAERVAVRLSAPDDPTGLEIGSIDGALTPDGLKGGFADASGAIGHVPLALSKAAGEWRLANGALHLTGGLQVADRAATPRFLPLVTNDVALDLADGRIDAAGTLRSRGHDGTIAHVVFRHDLGSGVGNVRLDVPGILFGRKGLQPEMLTPLTLGVIANVSGTIAGRGGIDWTPAGTTSSGTFETERLDLAAAFGPVTGIAGTIRFTDLLGLVTAPHQEARIAEINPGVAVANGVAHYQLTGNNRVKIEEASWPFAGGTLALDPATLDFGQTAERRLTFRVAGLDAAAFLQQLDFPNISATGTFDGRLPMIFDQSGGRIEDGLLKARGPGTLAYVGELSNAQIGTMGKLAFDALKAIRYSGLEIGLGGSLDGEIVTRVRFDGVRQATGDKGLIARMIRNLPFRFNIQIRAPFRGLVGSARSYVNPALLLQAVQPPAPIQPAESAPVR